MTSDLSFKLIEYSFIGVRDVIKKRSRLELLSRFAKKIEGTPILVVQIGREIVDDVRKHLGEPSAIVSCLKPLEINEIRLAAAECYKAIVETSRKVKKENYNKIVVVLSGPVALNFIVGQLTGLHLEIDLAYWTKEEYIVITGANRELLLKS